MDRRLQRRYGILVKSHMHTVPRTATGPALGIGPTPGFAVTQATWRFLNNDDVTLPALVEPLRQEGRQAIAAAQQKRDALAATQAPFALLVHDWCKLDYRRHTSKRDVVQLTHQTDVGYELTTALLVDAEQGWPLAPMELHLKTAEGVHSTRSPGTCADVHHLDQILPTMEASGGWQVPAKLVHVIDREADSVGHYRQWDGAGHLFLVRADDRRVQWRGESMLLSEIVAALEAEGAFQTAREIEFHGRPAQQRVAETEIVLDRPAKKRSGGRQREVAGRALSLRLVIAQACDASGVQGQWLLLTNAPATEADAALVALWYYWRWRIESFFKLLKSSGQEIEHWQQESGPAIARRLLVAAMACVVVWRLQRLETAEAEELRGVLIRLSGRQMKRKRPHTAPALLAGLYVLLEMLDFLSDYHGDLNHLRDLIRATIPVLDTG